MDSSVLAIIEQDDKSHGSESRRRADAKKDRATVNAPDSLLTPDKPLSLRVVLDSLEFELRMSAARWADEDNATAVPGPQTD